MHDLLTVGMEFLELGMVKITTEHQVPSLDRLVAVLEDRQATSFDVRSSPEAPAEEINLAEYIESMLTAPSLEAKWP